MVQVYKADPNIRDNSGKRPRQYMMAHDQVTDLEPPSLPG